MPDEIQERKNSGLNTA